MTELKIKPLSLNNCYIGRRFATKELAQYKRSISLLLPKMKVPEGKLYVSYTFGVSSKASDVDNLIKVFQDCLAECYGFNDKNIYRIEVRKQDVKKGEEFIKFQIEKLL